VRNGVPQRSDVMQPLLLRKAVPKVRYYAAFNAENRRSPKV
jgi:hypothetical protein